MRWVVVLGVIGGMVAVAPGPGVGAVGGSAHRPGAVSQEPAANTVPELRPLSTDGLRIVDDLGRDVLLRGANVNSLGEYWQGVPTAPATLPVTDADWDSMADRGLSVVRLLITWSKVEPTRGVIDAAYLDQVDEHVRAAAARGIYTVIDMHQDAYSAHIYTTDPADCPAGTSPAKGWDGAPEWATITDGESTCLTGSDRNSSPAVTRAWNNFYDDRDGIRGRFTASWAAVAERFAGRPEVAGFDLLNEPEVSAPADELTPKYEALIGDTVQAMWAAQADAEFRHIIFVEPAMPAGHQEYGLVIPDPGRIGLGTDGIVGSVHNYSESIDIGLGLTIEGMNDVIESLTSGLGIPSWGGEYGFWNTEPATLEKARRYAADEDRRLWGGAWWQWRQACGDPHSVRWSGSEVVLPEGLSEHLNVLQCPAGEDLGLNEDFMTVLGRGYPRAAPGRLTELRSDPDTGRLTVEAEATAADVGAEIVVWTPTVDGPEHQVSVRGLTDVREARVGVGRIITATVAAAGSYDLVVGPRDEDPDSSRPDSSRPDSPRADAPAAATPVPGRPQLTG